MRETIPKESWESRGQYRDEGEVPVCLPCADLVGSQCLQSSRKHFALQEPDINEISGLRALLETLQLTTDGGPEPVLQACVSSWLSDEQDGVSMVTIIDLVSPCSRFNLQYASSLLLLLHELSRGVGARHSGKCMQQDVCHLHSLLSVQQTAF